MDVLLTLAFPAVQPVSLRLPASHQHTAALEPVWHQTALAADQVVVQVVTAVATDADALAAAVLVLVVLAVAVAVEFSKLATADLQTYLVNLTRPHFHVTSLNHPTSCSSRQSITCVYHLRVFRLATA